jgi:asparaginyl-tRNA synthetase
VHTPIITASDCEGAGEMFRVTTLDVGAPPRRPVPDWREDFFGRPSYLTVSAGSSEGETFAMRLSNDLHLRADLPRRELEHAAPRGGVLDDRARDGLMRPQGRHGPGGGVRQGAWLRAALEHCAEDLAFFNVRGQGLIARLEFVVRADFGRVTTPRPSIAWRSPARAFEFPVVLRRRTSSRNTSVS